MSAHTEPADDESGRVRDDENYVDKERKKLILSNRQDVDDRYTELFDAAQLGEIDYQTAVVIWGNHVRNYVLSVEPLLRNSELETDDQDDDRDFYLDKPVGEITIQPPDDLRKAERTGYRNPVVDGYELVNGPPEPKRETIIGLKDIIEKEAVHATWEVQGRRVDTSGRRERRTTIRRSRSVPVNKTTLKNAVRYTDEFLQKVGIGISIDPDRGDAGFDYEDVLENGPPSGGGNT